MLDKKHYVLTARAESDLYDAKIWSLSRWGRSLTREYFGDLHEAAEYVASHHPSLSAREGLTGDTGLSFIRSESTIWFTCLFLVNTLFLLQ